MVPLPPSDVILNTTNTTIIISGIIPSTTYNVTVLAVAMGDTIGMKIKSWRLNVFLSNNTVNVTLTTDPTDPQI